MKYKVGELVKYYVLYGDVYIVKESGYGMITECNSYCYGDENTIVYTLLTNGKKQNFEEHELEKIKEFKCQ